MEVVLDSNVLFRILISQGHIMDVVSNPNLVLLAPEQLQREFERNRKGIVEKSCLSDDEFTELSSLLFAQVVIIGKEEYREFIPEAVSLLKDHRKDEDFVALSLARGCKVWTYEKLLFDIGVGISTKQISKELASEEKSSG